MPSDSAGRDAARASVAGRDQIAVFVARVGFLGARYLAPGAVSVYRAP